MLTLLKLMDKKLIIKRTEHWFSSFIIKFNICPFAKREYDRKSIHFSVNNATDIEQCLEILFKECLRLDSHPDIETTLVIYPNNFTQFEDYLDFVSIAEALLEEQNYQGTYQLASFHPDYCFEGEPSSDPANYTNRSPYPMLHLIRESSIERALKSYPDPEQIPEKNIKLTRSMGLAKLHALLTTATDSTD